MRRLLSSMLVVALLAVTGGCDRHRAAAESDTGVASHTDRYTQGGISMEPTVKAGQVITVRTVEHGYAPRRGDIVLFHVDGGQWGENRGPFLKRVIAVGGETIACCDPAGRVTVDGTPLAEPYVATNSPLDEPPNPIVCASRRFGPVAVATGTLFVMGDNRASSNDSRCTGPIPAASVFAVMVG